MRKIRGEIKTFLKFLFIYFYFEESKPERLVVCVKVAKSDQYKNLIGPPQMQVHDGFL